MKGGAISNLVRNPYYPSRFEYILSRVLQGLVSGKSQKDAEKAVNDAFKIAQAVEDRLDP